MYKEHKIRVASDLSKAVRETSRQESKGFNIQTEISNLGMCVKLNCQSNVKDYRHFLSHAQKLFTFHTFFLRKPQEPALLKAGTTPRRMKMRMQETGHPRQERRQRA